MARKKQITKRKEQITNKKDYSPDEQVHRMRGKRQRYGTNQLRIIRSGGKNKEYRYYEFGTLISPKQTGTRIRQINADFIKI